MLERKKCFWTKALSILLVVCMMMGTVGTSTTFAAEAETAVTAETTELSEETGSPEETSEAETPEAKDGLEEEEPEEVQEEIQEEPGENEENPAEEADTEDTEGTEESEEPKQPAKELEEEKPSVDTEAEEEEEQENKEPVNKDQEILEDETETSKDKTEISEDETVVPEEEEVLDSKEPDGEVKKFLDLVAQIPAEITQENLEEVAELLNGPIAEAYEALLGTEDEEREDVQAAVEVMAAAYSRVEELAEIGTQTFSGEIYGNDITISPNKRPSNIGAAADDNYGGSITKKVGETGLYQRLPHTTILGMYCGHIVAEYLPDEYCGIQTSYSNSGIIGNQAYVVGEHLYQGDYWECLRTTFEALKPGKTTVTLSYYVNYNILYEEGYCVCGRYTTIPSDHSWHRYKDIFEVVVNADYRLEYNANGGTPSPAATTRTVAATSCALQVTAQQPTRTGYKFLGWADSPDAKTAQYTAGSQITLNWVSGDTVKKTLYAVWTPDSAPKAPERTELYGILGNFVQVHCASNVAGHEDKTYSTWGNQVNGKYEAEVGAVYEENGAYFCDVTLNGVVYAKMYGMEPILGTGKTHTLAENETPTKTVKLKYTGEKWQEASGAAKGTVLAVFNVECKKSEITSFQKSLVKTQAEAEKAGITVSGITYPGTGKVEIPEGASATLLYKIMVTGTAGKAYEVTDAGAVWVGGNPMKGTIPASGSAVIYVTKTFTEKDINSNGKLVNNANVKPGKGDESNTSSTETTPAQVVQKKLTIDKKVTDASGTPISATTNPATVGDTVKYTITVTNPSAKKAVNVKVTDPLDSQMLQFVSAAYGAKEWTTEPANGIYELGDLEPGATATLVIEARLLKAGDDFKNSATVSKDDGSAPDGKDDAVIDEILDQNKKLTDISKALVAEGKLPDDVATADGVDLADYNFAEIRNGKAVVPAGATSVTLLYAITVTGQDGAKYEVTDEGAVHVGGAPLKGTLAGAQAVIYVAKTYAVTDGAVNVNNTAYLKPGDNTELDPAPADPDKGKPSNKVETELDIEKEEPKDRSITITFVDEEGNKLKENQVVPVKEGESYNVEDQIAGSLDDGKGNHYILEKVTGDLTGTMGDKDLTITATYTLDNIGGTDENGNDKGDGIPDKYQVVVTYRAVNGTLKGRTRVVVTLKNAKGEYATAAQGGIGHLVATQIPMATANEGYGNGQWTPAEPTKDYDIKGDTEFVITYSANLPENPEDRTVTI
ncbi:MAG: DUF11 domain-containing protein, partial [Lachnospiraceae bacterium]|nr:DUF11 domain-containing protein [Lachnospiraceae bacterium]